VLREPVLPPGSNTPRAGQSLRWMVRPVPFLEELQQRHGDVFTVHVFHEHPWVMVSDPELIKRVFTAPPDVLHAGEGNQILEPIIGPSSVLVLDEGAHMRQRKLLLAPFHGDRMERYGEVMREVVEAAVDRWPAGRARPALPLLQEITLDVILRAVFGVTERERLDALRGALRHMIDFITDPKLLTVTVLAGTRGIVRWRRLGFRDRLERVDELVLAEIARRRAADLGERDDILSLLLQASHEDGSAMSDAELRDELLTLLTAGHETTATALGWALERLVRHPDALARVVAEAEAGDSAYTDAAIRETLRLRPVLPIVARHVVGQPFELGDHLIPVGATIAPCILLLHRRPDIYPEPTEFRPERFLDHAPGTYTWIPFGGGVRRCIGASFALFEMRVVLSTLLARATVRADEPAPERIRRRSITLTPSRGARVALAPR
jgi:cytochrome P450 family 135